MEKIIKQFLSEVNQKNQNEPEFMQAVTEVAETVIPYIVSQAQPVCQHRTPAPATGPTNHWHPPASW